MGVIGGVKDNYRKSQAAVYVQNIFEHQKRNGVLISDPAALANRIVENGWQAAAAVFGKFPRPHKLALAAFSVSAALRGVPVDSGSFAPLLIALDFLLEGVDTNIDLEPFEAIDNALISEAVFVYRLKAGPEAKSLPELYRRFL